MASVKLVLRTKHQDKTGHCPLYIRVIKDRKAKFISAGQKLMPSEWDDARQKVKKNHPNSARLNAFLSQKVADAEGQVADFSRKNSEVSAKNLKDAIKGKDNEKFFQYAEGRLETIKNAVSISTLTRYSTDLRKFKKYIGERELYFTDITPVLLTDYMNYCYTTLKNGNTTVHTNLKTLKTIFRDAIKEDIVSSVNYPFDKVKVKKDPAKLRFLVREQIDLLKNLSLVKEPVLSKYRDMFLFSVYAGGLRKSDIFSLQWKHIDFEECRLSKKIRKTGHLHGFRLVPPAVEILKNTCIQKNRMKVLFSAK